MTKDHNSGTFFVVVIHHIDKENMSIYMVYGSGNFCACVVDAVGGVGVVVVVVVGVVVVGVCVYIFCTTGAKMSPPP